MGTIPILHQRKMRLRSLQFALIFIITILQARLMSCSGGVGLARPYLFRDFGIPAREFAQIAHIYQHKPAESAEDDFGSSEEEQVHYTAPLILDVDDPQGSNNRARWIPLDSGEDYDFQGEEEDEEQHRTTSISSTEFRSRSSPEMRSEDANEDDDSKHKSDDDEDSQPASGESRGILDFKLNPLKFWKGNNQDGEPMHSDDDAPMSDDPDGGTYFYPQPYDYDPYDSYPEGDQTKHPGLKPLPVKPAPKPKPKPKQKPKPVVRRKPPPRPIIRSKKRPPMGPEFQHDQQVHYGPPQHPPQKPGKLAMLSSTLSHLNPLRLIQGKKGNGPRRKPEHSQREQEKPEKDVVMLIGEPFGEISDDDIKNAEGDEDDDDDDDDEEEDDEEQDDDDDEEDTEADKDDDKEEDKPEQDEYEEYGGGSDDVQYAEVDEADYSGNPPNLQPIVQHGAVLQSDGYPHVQIQGDEHEDVGSIESHVPNLVPAATATRSAAHHGHAPYHSSPPATNYNTGNKPQKEKSIIEGKIVKYFSFGNKKRRRPRRPRPRPKPRPAKRPQKWKLQHDPAPLEVVGDTILKIVKNVGILPEYAKDEKYGGHHKIKGKFTKTRPITLHHGLLTEVLRR